MNIPAFYRLLTIFKPYIYSLFNLQYYSIVDLQGRIGANGEKIFIDSFYARSLYPNSQRGGFRLVYKTTQAKSGHNGITVHSPTVPWDGTQATLAAYQAGTGETDLTGSGCWVLEYERLNVFMAGAVADGTTSDSAVVQRCVDALTSVGGGSLRIPYGTYNFTSTVEITTGGIYIEGEGWETIITRSTDYGDTFYFHGNNTTGTVIDGVGISNMFIRAMALTTSGAHIHTNGVIRADISKIHCRDGFVLMQIDGTYQSYITDIFLNFTSLFSGSIVGKRCLEFGNATGSYAHPSCGGIWVNGFQMRGQSDTVPYMEYALSILSADGLWFSNGHTGNASIANIALRKTTSEILALVYMDNVMSDVSGGSDGMLLDCPGGGTMIDLKFNNHTLKGGGFSNIGLRVPSTCNAYKVKFSDFTISEYTKQGALIESTNIRDLEFNNGDVYGNSFGNTGTYAGYDLAAGVRDIKFLGGSSGGHNSSATGAATQSYGIKTAAGHSNVTINGMDLTGNVTGEIDYTAGNGVTIINCETTSEGIFSSVGKHILGAMNPFNDATGNPRQYQVLGGAAFSSGQLLARFSNDANSPALVLGKSRSDTVGVHAVVNASDEIGKISFEASDGTNMVAAATIRTLIGGTPGTNDMPGLFLVSVTPDGSATPTERLRINNVGFTSITGCFGLGAPVTKTGDFSVSATENFLINNKTGSACIVTLPAASSFTGRVIRILNYQAQTVDSASANVIQITGGAPATAIIAATAGKWATLVSDGSNWVITEAN